MNINEVGGATVYVGEGLLAGILGPDQFRFAEKVPFSGTLSTYTYHIGPQAHGTYAVHSHL